MAAARKRANLADVFGEASTDNPVMAAANNTAHNRVMGKRHRALLDQLAPNPENPRAAEDDEELAELTASMRQVGQLQSAVAVSTSVYLHHYPAHETVIGEAKWVVINGNRRLTAAIAAGLPTLDITIRDDLGDDDGLIDEAVMVENLHRRRLDPIREARFIERMVDRHGSQSVVADRIGKTQAFISQRLSLLRLSPEDQAKVSAGEIKVKEARNLAVHDRDVGTPPAQSPRVPTPKAAGKMLARYKKAHGADAVAALLRDELDDDETLTFLTAATMNLGPEPLDDLINALTTRRANLR